MCGNKVQAVRVERDRPRKVVLRAESPKDVGYGVEKRRTSSEGGPEDGSGGWPRGAVASDMKGMPCKRGGKSADEAGGAGTGGFEKYDEAGLVGKGGHSHEEGEQGGIGRGGVWIAGG